MPCSRAASRASASTSRCTASAAGVVVIPSVFGPAPAPLSDDARSQLRGELVTLRADIRAAAPRAGDRATQLHLQGAVHRIDNILEPKR